MLTPDQFRSIALGMDGAIESAHMGHPDFRAHGRIFATLHPGGEAGMVKLTPAQQEEFMHEDPVAFMPASGAWGRQGCTTVKLAAVDQDTLGQAITFAWQNTKKQTTVTRKKKK
jgi:hypothetical protein